MQVINKKTFKAYMVYLLRPKWSEKQVVKKNKAISVKNYASGLHGYKMKTMYAWASINTQQQHKRNPRAVTMRP